MAKRMVDTDIWKKQWFRELPLEMKTVWFYLILNCDHAGIYEVDAGLISFMIGKEITEDKILDSFNGQIVKINDGSKWFLRKFIKHQYGELSDKNNVHRSVAKILKSYGISFETLARPYQGVAQALPRPYPDPKQALPRPCPEAKDKEQEQDKDKEQVKDKVKVKDKEVIVLVEEYYKYMFILKEEYFKGKKINDYIDTGVDIIDKLVRIDKFELDVIKEVLAWASKDEFWSSQLFTLGGLRNRSKNGELKFENMYMRFKGADKATAMEDYING